MSLAADPASASVARRFVRVALLLAGRENCVDAAELAVSELVTNAVLQANTLVILEVTLTRTSAAVKVHDMSARLPAQRHWGESATTGRGLALVAAVTSAYGGTPSRPGVRRVERRRLELLTSAMRTQRSTN